MPWTELVWLHKQAFSLHTDDPDSNIWASAFGFTSLPGHVETAHYSECFSPHNLVEI